MKISNYKEFTKNNLIVEKKAAPRRPNDKQVAKISAVDKEEFDYIFQDLKDDFEDLDFHTKFWIDAIVVYANDVKVPILKSFLNEPQPGVSMLKDLSWARRGFSDSIIGRATQKIKTKKAVSDLKERLSPYFNEIEGRLKDMGLSCDMVVDVLPREVGDVFENYDKITITFYIK